MTDRQLRHQVITPSLAGHETTANLATWTCYLASQHPQVSRKLRLEFYDVLDGRDPVAGDLPSLKYLKAVVQESLRLYPPVWIISRKAIEEDEMGGHWPSLAGSDGRAAFLCFAIAIRTFGYQPEAPFNQSGSFITDPDGRATHPGLSSHLA